jgi:hypothetical protein
MKAYAYDIYHKIFEHLEGACVPVVVRGGAVIYVSWLFTRSSQISRQYISSPRGQSPGSP